jgi:rSAM/selenodomain-associated transferase 1
LDEIGCNVSVIDQVVKDCLIVFTRYPEAGKTKTRLIPVLGEEGAAKLQQQMTEHTLAQVRKLQVSWGVSVVVYFAGGDVQQMQSWLGEAFSYHPQDHGDLGDRLQSALATAFNNGMNRVVIIGIDCPSLQTPIMEQAFKALSEQDLVLGPAEDGGYYLIGLRRLIPELFKGIDWGTSEVLQQTVKVAQQQDLAIAYLPTLADIDRPEDLWIWEQMQKQ